MTLTAIDDISGVDSTYYRIDNGNWEKYIDPVMVKEDGKHTISFYSVDKYGNKEGEKSIEIKIDKIKPTIAFESPMHGHLYIFNKKIMPLKHTIIIGKAMIMVIADDETSGIGKVEFYVDDELKHTVISEPYEWIWDEVVLGRHALKVVAYDNAGNIAADEINVWIFNF